MSNDRKRGVSIEPDDAELQDQQPAPRLSVGKRSRSAQILRQARAPGAVDAGSPQVHTALARTGGDQLPVAMLSRLSDSLGQDLGDVRVHTGAESAAAADALSANAFAVGRDIHFADGKYQPDSPEGQRLIAHEVAHTVQQGSGAAAPAAQTQLRVSTPGDRFEREADAFADAFVGGGAVPAVSGGASAMISRDLTGDRAAPEDRTADYFNKPAVEAVRGRCAALMLRISMLETEANAAMEASKQRVLAFAQAYRDGWNNHVRILREARQEARNQEAWKDAAEEVALGILAAVTGGLVLEIRAVAAVATRVGPVVTGLARGALENVATQAAHGVAHTEDVGGTNIEATGIDPDIMEMRSYAEVANLAAALRNLAPAGNTVSNLNACAEYCIGEIKAQMGEGAGGDMSEADTLDMVGSILGTRGMLDEIQAAIDRSRVRLAGVRAVNEGTPAVEPIEVEKQIWTRWMAELPTDGNILDLDVLENYLSGLGLVTAASVWYSDSDEASDIERARERVSGLSRDRNELRRRQRDAERDATAGARADLERERAAEAAAPPSRTDSSVPVGERTRPDADFRLEAVQAARANAATCAAAITIADTRGSATVRGLATCFGHYASRYRRAWDQFAATLAAGRQSAVSQEAWVNRISGVVFGALTGGMVHGIEHTLVKRGIIGHAVEHLGSGPWAAATGLEKGIEVGGHRMAHAHVEGSEMTATGVRPESVDTATYQRMIELCQALGGLSDDRLTVGLILGAAEYCIGEIRGWLGGGYADMTEAEVIEMAGAVIEAGNQLRTWNADDIVSDCDFIDADCDTVEAFPQEDIEKELWTLWMASLEAGSDLTDLDPIQDRLAALGLSTNHDWWYSDDDAAADLAAARDRATGVHDSRRRTGVPSEGRDEGGEGGGGGH
jgi:hypothetical protein